MNTVWSDCVQGVETLYLSRALRFRDALCEQYMRHFKLKGNERMLEIGCGPGALTESLSRWYPDAEIIGTDRDTGFIRFALGNAPHLRFLEEDATAYPDKLNN